MDYTGIAKQVMRADIYEEAMKEIGYAHGGANADPEKLFDSTFDPAKPEEYAMRAAVNNLKSLMLQPWRSHDHPDDGAQVKLNLKKMLVDGIVLPAIGIGAVLVLWAALSNSIAKELPSPVKTWQESKLYILQPFTYRGEMDQGMGLFTWLSLRLVVKGYLLAILLGTPLGFLLGVSKTFGKIFDPIFQILRPVSPLAWLPLGLCCLPVPEKARRKLAVLFTIAVCSMWPTVLNTAVGVRAIPQDLLECGPECCRSCLWKAAVEDSDSPRHCHTCSRDFGCLWGSRGW